jgi:hypothetical protein
MDGMPVIMQGNSAKEVIAGLDRENALHVG